VMIQREDMGIVSVYRHVRFEQPMRELLVIGTSAKDAKIIERMPDPELNGDKLERLCDPPDDLDELVQSVSRFHFEKPEDDDRSFLHELLGVPKHGHIVMEVNEERLADLEARVEQKRRDAVEKEANDELRAAEAEMGDAPVGETPPSAKGDDGIDF
jgi:hypothetical protein